MASEQDTFDTLLHGKPLIEQVRILKEFIQFFDMSVRKLEHDMKIQKKKTETLEKQVKDLS